MPTPAPERETRVLSHEGLVFGCDYNPEQWPREVWHEDVALMREAGITLVAVNIFGWATVNPADGVWDFTLLDEILELLHANHIAVNLGTATASTPAWLTTAHPEVLPVAADGTRRFPGGRQAWCPSSPVYRERSLDLVTRIADRYGDHPAIALWHVSNELGCHNALCYCDVSAAAFREWLREKYGSVEALNSAWGTTFWSQRYGAWEEILPPLATLSTTNPGQELDFHRFSSDAMLEQYRAEAEVLRARSTAPVTTNFMVAAHIRNLDYWSWTADMDLIANDHYLDHRLADPVAEMSFTADLTRGLAGGKPWLLMETAVGAVNWQPLNVARVPGELERQMMSHLARGADGVCFFQWRASVQGSEKFHSALVPHAGTNTRAWREVVALGQLMKDLTELQWTRVQADVALLFSWDSWWAGDAENRPSSEVKYLEQVHAAYSALRASGVTVDVVAPGADLSAYKLIILPELYSVSDTDAGAIADAVAAGTSAFVTFFSGIVDENDAVRLGGYPGAFRDMLGIVVEEFLPVAADVRLSLCSGGSARLWSEFVRPDGAEVVDSFADGPVAGSPAVTRHQHGAGTAWYAATALEADSFAALITTVVDEAGATRLPGAGPEVEVVRRVGGEDSYLFVINHSRRDVNVSAKGTELISGVEADGVLVVPAGAARIVREESA
ncbi:beta-galactosidase [Demequina aurantiaca]|uniref:beta-galactosidase n=1 Tax=Demequina aurantiaca TaxID=676200 RepID=UPI0007838F6A|nr:beta-galactosidase [Demequina aurantiaca]